MYRRVVMNWKNILAMLLMAVLLLTCSGAVVYAATDPLKPADHVSDDGNVILHKQAERVGPDEWLINVSATIQQEAVEKPKLEVVFVLDVSSTMNACADMVQHNMYFNGGGLTHTHTDTCPPDCTATVHVHVAGSVNSYCYKMGGTNGIVYYDKRIDVARSAIKTLAGSLDGADITYVYFSDVRNTGTTDSYDNVYVNGQTYIMNGVNLGLTQFSTDESTKILVLVTDGAATDGLYTSTAFQNFDGTVFTVGFNHVDENLMGMVKNGGSYYQATKPEDLTAAFNQIEKQITAMLVDPMGPTVGFEAIVEDAVEGDVEVEDGTIVWRPDDNQNLTGKVVEYSYRVQLNDQAAMDIGEHTGVKLNNPTYFRYGVTDFNDNTELFVEPFPIPEAKYEVSSVQVKWQYNGTNIKTPSAVESVISDYGDPEFTETDYHTITQTIPTANGKGYYEYTGTTVTNGEKLLSGVGAIDASVPVAYTVVHNYRLVTPGELTLSGEKVMDGRSFQNGDSFTFRLTPVGNAPMPASGRNSVTITPTSGNTAGYAFDTIVFSNTGTYQYKVTEDRGSLNRVSYDTTEYTVTVRVTQNSDGSKYVGFTAMPDTSLSFRNIYPTLGNLTINKSVTNSLASSDSFTFHVTASDVSANEMQKWATAHNYGYENGAIIVNTGSIGLSGGQGAWSVTLQDLPTSTYTVTEVGADGYTTTYQTGNSAAKRDVQPVAVRQDETAAVTVNNTRLTGNLTVTKTVTGYTGAKEFSITLTPGDDVSASEWQTWLNAGNSASVTLSHNGTATFTGLPAGYYIVTEDTAAAEIAGYKLTVTGSGEEVLVNSGNASAQITNAYERQLGSLKIVKTAEGATVPATATFTITKPDGTTETVTYAQFINGEYTVSNLPVGDYTVTEDEESAKVDDYTLVIIGSGAKAQVTQNGTATIEINNVYTQHTGSLKIVKTASGAEMPADATFTITGPNNYAKTISYSEFQDGKYELTGIPVGEYTVTEDEESAKVDNYTLVVSGSGETAQVTQDGTATIQISNIYTLDTGTLQIIKKSIGATTPGKTIFFVDGPDGYAKTIAYSEFVDGIYTLTELPVGEYTVREKDGTAWLPGYTVTVTGNEQEVSILKDGISGVVITNTYTSYIGNLIIRKTASGADVPADTEFTVTGPNNVVYTFKYSDFTDGQYVLRDVVNGGYTVTENVESAQVEGFTLSVTGNDTKVYMDGGVKMVTIHNEYAPNAEVTITGVKTMQGRDFQEGDSFTFELMKDGVVIDTAVIVPSAGSRTEFRFGKITFTADDVGTHVYEVREERSTLPGVISDPAVKEVTVEVALNDEGVLTAQIIFPEQPVSFVNRYVAETPWQLKAVKTVNGRTPEPQQKFTFELLDETGNVLQSVQNVGGAIIFDTLTFGLDDADKTYTYTVREVQQTIEDYTLDSRIYTVTVTPEVSADGKLTIRQQTTCEGADAAEIAFDNLYEAPASLTLTAVKTVNGAEPAKGQIFDFELVDANGMVLQTVQNVGGVITFDALTYRKADAGKTFVYTVREKQQILEGYTLDNRTYTVAVTPELDAEGKLQIKQTMVCDGFAVTDIVFDNRYEAPVSLTLTGVKTVNGGMPAAGEAFEFELLDENGSVIQTVQNVGSTITFGAMTYHKEDAGKTFIYTVREAQKDIEGYTLDSRIYTVAVTPSMDNSGMLQLQVVITCDGMTVADIRFDNQHHEHDAAGSLQLTAIKTVDGEAPNASQVFTFLLEGEGVSMAAVNNGSSIIFKALQYTLADAGKTYTYTIREMVPAMDGVVMDNTVYTVQVTISDNGDGTLNITPVVTANGAAVDQILFNNTTCEALTISKRVAGGETAQRFSMTVRLYHADGTEMTEPVSCRGDWTGTLVSGDSILLGHGQSVTLNGLKRGMRYVVEEKAEAAYTTTVNGRDGHRAEGVVTSGSNRVDFVNTMKPGTFTVTKVWQGVEGGEIQLTLYANGVKLSPQPAYTRSGNTYTYSGLPLYDEDGARIVYSAKETYMEGYLTIYDNIGEHASDAHAVYNGGTIINRAMQDFRVRKVWQGLKAGENPPKITLTLYCNGEVVDRKQPEPDQYGWYVYGNLPKTHKGQPAVYYVIEEAVDGFMTIYTSADGERANWAENGAVITNVRIPATGDSSPIALWTAMLTASAAMLTLLSLRRRKHG